MAAAHEVVCPLRHGAAERPYGKSLAFKLGSSEGQKSSLSTRLRLYRNRRLLQHLYPLGQRGRVRHP